MRQSNAERAVQTIVERRRSPRAPVIVRIEYATVDALFSDFTANINEGGVFIETDTPAPLDSIVQIQFSLPGTGTPVKTRARVVRITDGSGHEPQGMGLEFDDLDSSARSAINALVQQLRV